MRFSHKDLLLLIGILVAAIIAFTTLVYSETTGINKQSVQKNGNSASAFAKRLIKATALDVKVKF